LTHIGGPESDGDEERGLHGRISNIPASVESIIQPDPIAGELDMSITGVVKQTSLFGVNLELRRTISSTIGGPAIRVHDVVTNRGPTTVPHMMLYHCNLGWPIIDEGANLVWKGKCESLGRDMDDELFNSKHNFRKCQPPLKIHKGREAVGIVDVRPDRNGICTVGVHNRKLKMAVAIKYPKEKLPLLTNWQHWGFGDYVCGIEPGTNPPTGQNAARKERKLLKIRPGQSRTYDVELSVLTDRDEINKFLKKAGQ
jgi:hypothetical protein